MKKTMLTITSFITVILVILLTGSSYGYTSKDVLDVIFISGNASKQHSPSAASNKERDIKISSDYIRETQVYNYRDNYGNTEVITGKTLKGIDALQESRLVVIDAGHGGNDNGTKDNGLAEKDITLDVARRLDSELKRSGIRTYMIRTDDRYIDHRDRIQLANDKNAALYISLHCDWFRDPSLNGTTTLYDPSGNVSIGGLSEIEFASIIQTELMKNLETRNRGINDRNDLAILRRAKMPSVLIELGFLSNKNDSLLLGSEIFRQKSAETLSAGIRKALYKIDSGK